MKKVLFALGAVALSMWSVAAFADDAMKSDSMMHDNCMAMHFKTTDKNNDGMVSKSEYMDAMAKNWEDMPKSKDGMASMDDMKKHMQMMHDKCKDQMGSMNH
ncbi:MAG: hypothetical protein ABIS07_12760 [Dokdonella sp.]